MFKTTKPWYIDIGKNHHIILQRVVSFLPSATELIYALGIQDRLHGVTHECTYPEQAKTKPQVIRSVIDSQNLDSRQINDTVSQQKDIFVLDKKALLDISPDLIISQDTCEVCAAHTTILEQAINSLKIKPTVYSSSPHSIKEILDDTVHLAQILGVKQKGQILKNSLEQRIQNINTDGLDKPSVLAIEWLAPFYTSGHWVPDMVNIAGGKNLASHTGEHSRLLDIQEIIKINPDIIILMPCGFDAHRTKKEYEKFLKNDTKWNTLKAVQNNMVIAVDANSFFSKSSIRTITGIEILAKIFHPDRFASLEVPADSYIWC